MTKQYSSLYELDDENARGKNQVITKEKLEKLRLDNADQIQTDQHKNVEEAVHLVALFNMPQVNDPKPLQVVS